MRPILATGLLLALACCNQGPPPGPKVDVSDAVVTLPAVPRRPGAAYFTLRTNNDPMRIVSVSSPKVERIELHETVEANGVSRMVRLENSSFPATGELEFKPGGRHAMLFGVDSSVKQGGAIPLTFTFDPAPPVTVQAKVQGPGGGRAGH
jgi:hypothetical protein